MPHALTALAPALLLASCAVAPSTSSTSSDLLTISRSDPSIVTDHLAELSAVADHRIAGRPLGDRRFVASPQLTQLAATSSGLEVAALVVSCALPLGVSVVVADPTDPSREIEIPGEIGIADRWARAPLGRDGRAWVTACALSRLGDLALVVVVSDRGARGELRLLPGEAREFTVQAGAFFGDFFSAPVEVDACSGAAQDLDPRPAVLGDYVCATPDPARPRLTLCGFSYAGPCAGRTEDPRDHRRDVACEGVAPDGAYLSCRSPSGRRFRQVVTTFLSP